MIKIDCLNDISVCYFLKKDYEEVIKNSNKVAMSLSDLFCVERHKPHFVKYRQLKSNV